VGISTTTYIKKEAPEHLFSSLLWVIGALVLESGRASGEIARKPLRSTEAHIYLVYGSLAAGLKTKPPARTASEPKRPKKAGACQGRQGVNLLWAFASVQYCKRAQF
jgi:hypothetical protein